MRFAVALFGLALLACSKSEPSPTPAPVASASASVGTCDWVHKCVEWTGDVAIKRETCGLLKGRWSDAPCAVKKNAAAECRITGARTSGVVYYSGRLKDTSERDCQSQGGVHRFVQP